MADISVNLAGISLRNPLITASGTFGYGREYEDLIPFDKLGAITVKGVSPFPSDGNPVPRSAEVFGGMLNAIGLQNPGIDKFISDEEYLPFLRTVDCPVFVNIWGRTIEQYAEVAERLEAEKEGIAALEINISCPNIKEGGVAFGTDLKQAAAVVSAVRKVSTLPLITKLSPNVSNIADFARCVVDNGSDMISLINTITGMAVDIQSRKPLIKNITGGYSGPGIKPIALRMVYETRKAVKVPIIGMGGIYNAIDALEFMLCGANAFAVGTAIFSDPKCLLEIPQQIEKWLDEQNIEKIEDFVGKLEV